MKPFFMRILLMLAVIAALGESTARAEFVDFSYGWTVNPAAFIPGGTGSVLISLTPNSTGTFELGAASPTLIPGGTVTTNSSATPGSPDTFNTPFSLKLALKDTASGQMGDLTFSGTIAGNLTTTSSTLNSTFNNPTQTLLLGTHSYEVSIDPTVLGLPFPTSDATALLDALIRVKNSNGLPGGPPSGPPSGPPVGTADTPEPSSLVLGGLAIAGLAARRWSRLKRPAA